MEFIHKILRTVFHKTEDSYSAHLPDVSLFKKNNFHEIDLTEHKLKMYLAVPNRDARIEYEIDKLYQKLELLTNSILPSLE